MKTLNTLLKAVLLITFLSLTSCSSDDDEGGSAAKSNSFTVDGGEYDTPNVFLVINGSGSNFDKDYSFIFTNKTMREDAINGISLATDANQFAFLEFDNGNGTLSTMNAVTNQITVGSHPLSNDTTAGLDITNWDLTYMHNSQQFGVPIGYTSYDLEPSFSGAHMNIESISIDVAARTGTIECTYVYYSYSTGVEFRGEYQGNFTILNDTL
ncbi:MAG: hypothetical protein V3U80_00425 [Flavobacteriaceae bacterium]